jgi:hypothetical protein
LGPTQLTQLTQGKAKKAKKEACKLEKKVAHLEGAAQQLNRELKEIKEKQLQYLNAMQRQTDTLEIALASLDPFPWASQQPSQRSGQQASDTSWMNRQEAQVLLKVVALLLQQEVRPLSSQQSSQQSLAVSSPLQIGLRV